MQPRNQKTLKRVLLTAFTALFFLTQTAQAASRYVFIHTDMLGSPMATTDERGNIISRENVTPYGDSLGKRDSTNSVAVGSPEHGSGYTGHVRDRDLGLTYMQARYYDPTIGRFMGADPVGFLDNGDPAYFNRYAYAKNNPYKYSDPNGEYATQVIGGLALVGSVVYVEMTTGAIDGEQMFNSLSRGMGAISHSVGKMFSEGNDIASPNPESGDILDPSDKGGELTKSGRALDKHGSTAGKRAGSSAFPPPSGGPKQRNKKGREIIDDILNDSGGNTESGEGANRWQGTRVTDSTGRGADFDRDGNFQGFTEPNEAASEDEQ